MKHTPWIQQGLLGFLNSFLAALLFALLIILTERSGKAFEHALMYFSIVFVALCAINSIRLYRNLVPLFLSFGVTRKGICYELLLAKNISLPVFILILIPSYGFLFHSTQGTITAILGITGLAMANSSISGAILAILPRNFPVPAMNFISTFFSLPAAMLSGIFIKSGVMGIRAAFICFSVGILLQIAGHWADRIILKNYPVSL